MQTASAPPPADTLQSFLIDHSHIRGRLVRLNEAADTIIGQHDYPEAVSALLAEMLVVVSMLASNLKTEGLLTLQASGDGPLRLMVVDATHEGHLRGYADLAEDALFRGDENLAQLFGHGRLVISLDTGGNEGGRYQGIVELTGESFSDSLRQYFTQSQQAEMAVKLAVGRRPQYGRAGWSAAGIMIEQLPEEGGTQAHVEGKSPHTDPDLWPRIRLLMETVQEEELLDKNLTGWELLTRLFHEDGVWAYPPRPLLAHCRCSRPRIAGILRTIPLEELNEMMVEGQIHVNCQFCNRTEMFTEAQVELLHEPGTRH